MATVNTSSSLWDISSGINSQSSPTSSANYAQKVEEAARGFETILVRQMLREIRNSSFDPDKQNTTNNGYLEMADDQYAAMITKGNGLGFAKKMTEQLIQQSQVATQIKSGN